MVNINDFDKSVVPTVTSDKDMLDLIFDAQREHTSKYIPIEVRNNLCWDPSVPVEIDSGRGQARLKDFFYRTIEELTEADQARDLHITLVAHVIEELGDALHFLVETYILAGMSPQDVVDELVAQDFLTVDKLAADKLVSLYPSAQPGTGNYPFGVMFQLGCWGVVRSLGDAGNFLKQKPWKQTHQYTDVKRFRATLSWGLPRLLGLCHTLGASAEDVFEVYFKKTAVNKFRRDESNY